MPALLADIGGVFAVIFLLISFIGWIINMINAQNPPPAPNRGPQRRPRARDRKVQNEIEQFLKEAMGNKPGGPRDEVQADEIELIEPAPQRRPPSPVRQTRPAPQPPAARKPQPAPDKPGSGVASRHIESSDLGRGVSSHVKDHMRERVSRETSQHLPHSVNQTVTKHLGDFTADDVDPRSSVKPFYGSRAATADPTGLLSDLRNPQGIRKAILMQEILARPRPLRK